MTSLCALLPANRLRALVRGDDGNVAIIFALALLPILLGVGAAIDYGHANAVRTKLQAALDATSLMLAHQTGDMTDKELLAMGEKIFKVNFPMQDGIAVSPLTLLVNGQDLTLSATAEVGTYLMGLGGINTVDVGASTEVVQSQDSYEVVMVLDNTGSMGGSKIVALKDAADALVDDLFGNQQSSDLLNMGLVPFSFAVNVGTDNKTASWMDTQAKNPLHAENFDSNFKKDGLTRFKLFDRLKNTSWAGCVEARKYPYDVQDTAPTAGDVNSLFVPYFAPDEPGDRGSPDRDYVNSYLDDKITSKNPTNQQRQEYTDKYYAGARPSNGSPNAGCNAEPILPLTNVKSKVTKALKDMKASGYTNIVEGLMWGWRVISPGAPFTEGKPYETEFHHKIIILLTDGYNQYPNYPGYQNHNKSEYGPYGYMAAGRLKNTTNMRDVENEIDKRTATACTNVKNAGIELYTITFDVTDAGIKSLMSGCASKPSMYFNSPDTSTLKQIFKTIADQITQLRIKA